MSETDEIPSALLERHPELVAVGEALRQYRKGDPITARCHQCGHALEVVEIAEVGALVVTCPDKHVSFRARRTPTAL